MESCFFIPFEKVLILRFLSKDKRIRVLRRFLCWGSLMGSAIPCRRYLRRSKANYQRPLVFCRMLDGITDNAVSMNVAIAKRLASISPSSRSMRIEHCFISALCGLPDDVIIRDIDVLFNPAYEIDVVALLCSAYRKHKFDLVWPGRFEDNQLVYAEEGYPDYKVFNTDRYDITCIY